MISLEKATASEMALVLKRNSQENRIKRLKSSKVAKKIKK